jgi:hypothetical protein
MSSEGTTANTSRKRMKETAPHRPPQRTYTKRTAAQLAHLAELVEEKKPGSLSGSFSVFELAAPEPNVSNNAPGKAQNVQLADRVSRHVLSSTANEAPAIKEEPQLHIFECVHPWIANVISTIPNISRSSLQPTTNIQLLDDMGENSTAGLLNRNNELPLSSLVHCQQAPAFDRDDISSYSYEPTQPRVSQQIPPFPLRHVTYPSRTRAISYPPETTNPVKSGPMPDFTERKASESSSKSSHFPMEQLKVEETWKFSSRSMLAGPKGAELAHLEDCLAEDVPIRAVLHGWDSIGESWELPPFWQIIRQLDENLFFMFDPIERLGVFRIVHLLMRFHSDPSAKRASTLPKFFNSK